MTVPTPDDLISNLPAAFDAMADIYRDHANARAEYTALRHYVTEIMAHRRKQILARESVRIKDESGCGVTEADNKAHDSDAYKAFLDEWESHTSALQEAAERSERAYWKLRLAERKLNMYQSLVSYTKDTSKSLGLQT